MPHIELLDSLTIDKIAAGEVVERPFSVVKELTENALDAGASAVTVEIRDGGASLIRVTDNGCGIHADEVRKAFLRHSTSKIASVEDLLSARTLGFRGEALASVAAVARVELLTKTADALTGVRYVIEGGAERFLEEAAVPDGTTVKVENLFYNVPVRRKFLKKPGVEAAAVTDYVQRLILGHPDVAFRYYNGGREPVLLSSGRGELRNCVFAVYGRDIADKLLEVSASDGTFAVSGFVSRPQLARANRSFQSLFINGRYVRSALIDKVLDEVYKDFLVPGTFPVTVLHLSMDPSLLDVNVHPTKMEVRFGCEEALRSFLHDAVLAALRASSLVSREGMIRESAEAVRREEPAGTPIDTPAAKPIAQPIVPPIVPAEKSAEPPVEKPTEKPAEHPAEHPAEKPVQISVYSDPIPVAEVPELREDELPFGDTDPVPEDLRLIGQAFGTYWLAESRGMLYVMDQHAAHERVLYDRFRAMLREGPIDSQLLLEPLTVTVDPREVALLPGFQPELCRMGFEAEAFGEDCVIVRAVPFIFNSPLEAADMAAMLDLLAAGSRDASRDLLLDKMAMTACKAAVKGNSLMSEKEAEELLRALFASENPYNCPHGRPTLISLTKYELERRFKRA